VYDAMCTSIVPTIVPRPPLGRHPAPAPNPVLRLPFLVELEDMTWVYRFQGEKMEKGRLTFGYKRFIFCYYPCPDCLTSDPVKFSTIQLHLLQSTTTTYTMPSCLRCGTFTIHRPHKSSNRKKTHERNVFFLQGPDGKYCDDCDSRHRAQPAHLAPLSDCVRPLHVQRRHICCGGGCVCHQRWGPSHH
jgi:hypothetical protein